LGSHVIWPILQARLESREADEGGEKLWQCLVHQTELVAQICTIMRDVKNVRGGTQKKIEKLRQLLSGLLSELIYFDEPIPLPLEPRTMITGIIPSESSIFKSALHPLRLTFRTEGGGKCKIIFKKGDDLRQDQLVCGPQMDTWIYFLAQWFIQLQ
jgi:phosphatidylinositol 3-kinase